MKLDISPFFLASKTTSWHRVIQLDTYCFTFIVKSNKMQMKLLFFFFFGSAYDISDSFQNHFVPVSIVHQSECTFWGNAHWLVCTEYHFKKTFLQVFFICHHSVTKTLWKSVDAVGRGFVPASLCIVGRLE